MRNFNANFIIEKNKRADGPAPINLLTFAFATPAYISDRDVTPSGGPAHEGIVKSWGFLDTSIKQTPGSGVLGSIEIADLQLTLINSTSPRFSDNFTDEDPPENVIVTLYQWFATLAYSEKEIIFKGVITGLIKYDEYTCTVTVRGIFDKYNKQLGSDLIMDSVGFPDADPDEYGKMQNIVYGSCPDVPCRATVSGDVNSLTDAITAAQTSIELSDSSYFPASGIIGIDAEQISYTGNAANNLTGCTRGYGGTTATTHDAGAPVWEELSAFVYLVAGHPVKTIGDIYVDGVRVTALCTKYTGQAGNELAGWGGKAVFTVPSRLTRQQAIDLLLSDGITINDAIAVADTIGVSDGISVSDTIGVSETIGVSDGISVSDTIGVTDGITVSDNIAVATPTSNKTIYPNGGTSNIIDGSDATTVGINANSCYAGFPSTSYGSITTQYIHFSAMPAATGGFSVSISGGWTPSSITLTGLTPGTILTFRLTKGGGGWDDNVTFNSGGTGYICEVRGKEIIYTPANPKSGNAYRGGSTTKSGSASKSGTVSKTGSVSKSGSASKAGTVTKSGAASKSGTVTRTGAVTLSGNSVADVKIGKLVTANVDGYRDDGAGTYTGTPYALIERPDHVYKHIWSALLGASSADVDAVTFAAAGAFYAANSYKFALLINKPVLAVDLLMRLALQCRSRFLVTAYGTVKLIVRQLGQASGHAIPATEIKRDSVSVERSPASEIINYLNLCFELDLTRDAGDDQAYYSVWNIQNAESISRYGQREWKGDRGLFLFDAVRDADMAEHVGLYLIDYHQQARRMPKFGVFLDNMEIEPGDIIGITHPLDAMSGFTAEVQKMLHHIGNKKQIDYIDAIAVEN